MPDLKSLVRRAAWPVRRAVNPKFDDLVRRLVDTRQAVHDEGTATRQAVVEDVHHVVGTYAATSTESLSFVGAQLRELEATVLRLVGPESIGAVVQRLVDEGVRDYVERLDALAEGEVADLDGAAANLLNYAGSHRGFAAQAELWLNPPIVLAHAEGKVELSHVNERIAEIPWAVRALGPVPLGARILDFGASENALALSLASMGYQVTALDLRPYPFEHPNLTRVAQPIETWEAEPASFDAVMCVSTVEHVGLDWYGKQDGDPGADRAALTRLGELLKPDGRLILTVPYGAPSVDALQRRYDRAGLAALTDGWTVEDEAIVEQVDDRTWMPVEESTAHAAAMLVLRPSSAA